MPAWPWLRTGFLGTVESAGTKRRLGIGLPPGPRGGPVFDPGGRLVGMALARAGQPDRLLPVSALRRDLGETLGVEAVRPDPARMALDELYERGLRLTLQVIAQP